MTINEKFDEALERFDDLAAQRRRREIIRAQQKLEEIQSTQENSDVDIDSKSR